MTDYTVYADGGCRPNPGRGGYGAVVICNRTGEMRTYSGSRENVTNNRMEILAAIVGLKAVPEGCSAVLISDSQYAINCIQGIWARRMYEDMFGYIDGLLSSRDVTFRWVKGHGGDPMNELADRLSSEAISRASGCAGQVSASAFARTVRVPKTLRRRAMPPTPDAWMKRYRVGRTCAALLVAFCSKAEPSFRDYASLKTGGPDFWSSLDEELLKKKAKVSATALKALRENLPAHMDFMEALRWYCRGLPVEMSVRKVLVNREIQEKASASGKEERFF